tara:strand:- start:647 stop:892 length:246 start_codon:yes stop_codon:yes gene_type:complete
METVKKKIDFKLCEFNIESNRVDSGFRYRYEIGLYCDDFIDNFESVEFFIDTEEPETLKEFLETNNIKKSVLVDWLNKNYK